MKIKYITFNKLNRRWLYTPYKFTAYFGHSGWICLDIFWLWEMFKHERNRRRLIKYGL